MNQQQLAGILLVVGFVFILAGSIAVPPRLFQEPKSASRLEIIANHRARWVASNVFFALAGVVTSIGLGLFSLHLWGNVNAWVNGLAVASYALGTVAWVMLMYGRTTNPEPYFSNYSFSPFTLAMLWLILAGMLFYGGAFLQAGYPGWLGVGTIAGMALIGGAALIFPTQFYASFPPQVFYLFTLVAGIVMLRQ